GGCWVEGNTMKEAYRWKKTIGSIWERPTQWNIWGYWATHGVGFHEYLLICEELGAKPLFCINVGMSHRENVPMEKMDEFVQDALDCIEYCNGPVDSKWGAIRAAAGHPKPFNLEYLEIGNENGGPEYNKRYKLIAEAVRAKYPSVKLVFDNWGSTKDVDAPRDLRDDHFYMTPDWFMMNAGHYSDPKRYDARSGKFGVFVGEYAVTQGTGKFGSLRAAIGEAAFMTGLENASDVVKLAAYAPLFANVKHQRWSPDMIYVGPASNFVNPSFEVQRLFAENRGKDLLETKVTCERVSEPGAKLRFGVGSWSGQAAFKDVRVVDADGKVLYENALTTPDAVKDWKRFGSGKWEIVDGALTQTGPAPKSASTAIQLPGTFGEATITLKAKRVSGPEGFLVLLGDAKPVGGRWVNFGGWGNGQHGVESPDFDGTRVSGSIEQGRWYDVKVEIRGGKLRAWLDGKLALESGSSAIPAIMADATTSPDGREIIVKVVNCSRAPVEAVVSIAGAKLADRAKMQLFTGPDADACNSMENPDRLHAVDMPVEVADGTIRRVFPALSFSVIRVPAASSGR
ncbi:MAG: alpha-L-arabinofuranosidase, partial [Kiritimatiellae bacterium]|nr:alpha-L-arabinofuranosidase [Kiritimatiellia bacterium]